MSEPNLAQMEVKLRIILEDELPSGETEGEWSSAALQQALLEAEAEVGRLENEADPSIRADSCTITVTVATELQDIPESALPEIDDYIELRNNAYTGDTYPVYHLISMKQRNGWRKYTPTGYACYFQNNQLAILPAPAVGDTFDLVFVRKIIPMAAATSTELTKTGQTACLYGAAEIAVGNSNDVILKYVNHKYEHWKKQIPKIRRKVRGFQGLNPGGDQSYER
jgi:hypothetical protein